MISKQNDDSGSISRGENKPVVMRRSSRHSWDGKCSGNGNDYKGGYAITCNKCGCVKEFVNGIPTYFIDDIVFDRIAPRCDNRLLNGA